MASSYDDDYACHAVLIASYHRLGKKADFLTVQDAKEILEVVMPKRHISQEEFVQMLFEKQKKRVSARQSHHRHHQ